MLKLHVSRVSTTPHSIIDISQRSDEQTDSEDSDIDSKPAAVARLIISAEDLRAVDASNVGAHDNPVLERLAKMKGRRRGCSHGHGESSLFRIITCQGHPRDVERMRECAECLGENNTEVADSSAVELCEDAIEDIAQKMHTQSYDDRLSAFVTERNQYSSCINS